MDESIIAAQKFLRPKLLAACRTYEKSQNFDQKVIKTVGVGRLKLSSGPSCRRKSTYEARVWSKSDRLLG